VGNLSSTLLNNTLTSNAFSGDATPLTTTTPGGTVTSTNGPATLAVNATTNNTFFAGSITNTAGNTVTLIRSGAATAAYWLLGKQQLHRPHPDRRGRGIHR